MLIPGKRYKIIYLTEGGVESKRSRYVFMGTFIKEYPCFYLFLSKKGYRVTFLKKDVENGSVQVTEL